MINDILIKRKVTKYIQKCNFVTQICKLVKNQLPILHSRLQN
jgi:hypothetical protein